MLAVVVVATLLAGAPSDPTLAAVERAFTTLRADKPLARPRARKALEQATPAFDDLATADNDLQRAFRSDVNKPWRGLPHERVLTLVTLAALDIGAGRCDVAIPTLKNAAFHDLRLQASTAKPDGADAMSDSDAVVVHALLVHCLQTTKASAVDVAAAVAGLDAAVALAGDVDGTALKALIARPRLRLVFAGTAPKLVRQGQQGEEVSFTTVADDAVAFVVPLSPSPSSSSSSSSSSKAKAKKPTKAEGLLVWSSARQATTAQRKDIKALLSKRAGQKQQLASSGTDTMNRGFSAAPTVSTPVQAAGAAGLVMTGMGMRAMGAMVDARADTRQVQSLPDRVFLIAD